MSDRFWIGGTGNWSESSNWSTTSGGSGGASVPTSSDSVYFDANSFTGAGQTVTVDENAYCLDMDWTGATNNPTLAGSKTINIYGSLIFINDMTNTFTSNIFFKATSTGKTITTNGINLLSQVTFDGVGGSWEFLDDFTISTNSNLTLTNGILNCNDKTIICCGWFASNNTNIRSLLLGSSVLIIDGTLNIATATNLNLNAGTSTIRLTKDSQGVRGGSLTYHNVELQGDNCTITGDNTFNDLKIKAGNTINMTAGTTQNIGNLHSDTAGTPATLSCASGTVEVSGATIQDITATGGATFKAYNSTDVSGNTGWSFENSLASATSISIGISI